MELPLAGFQTATDPSAALRTGEALLAAWLRHLNLAYLDLAPRQKRESQDGEQLS
jgi:hypothetical protein